MANARRDEFWSFLRVDAWFDRVLVRLGKDYEFCFVNAC